MRYRLLSIGILLSAFCLHSHAQSLAYVLNINNQTNFPVLITQSNFNGMAQWISQNHVITNTIRPNSNNNFPLLYQSLDPSVRGSTVLVVNCPAGQNFVIVGTEVANEIPYITVSEVRVGPGATQCITLNQFGHIYYTNSIATLVIRTINNINTSNSTRSVPLSTQNTTTGSKAPSPTPFNTITPILNK